MKQIKMTGRIYADLIQQLWSQFSRSKRERLLYVNTEPREMMHDLVKKKLQTLPISKSHSEPREDSTLLFIFPDAAHTKLLFMLSGDQHYYFLKANNDFFSSFHKSSMARLPLMSMESRSEITPLLFILQ